MMYENIGAGVVNDGDLPWIPFAPYSADLMIK